MALEFNRTTFLKVYTGEDVLYDDIPLYKAILREARRLGLSGGTVMKGIEGYAAKLRGVGRAVNTFISGNANLPVVVEIVDKRENIDKILPWLEKTLPMRWCWLKKAPIWSPTICVSVAMWTV